VYLFFFWTIPIFSGPIEQSFSFLPAVFSLNKDRSYFTWLALLWSRIALRFGPPSNRFFLRSGGDECFFFFDFFLELHWSPTFFPASSEQRRRFLQSWQHLVFTPGDRRSFFPFLEA